MKKYHVYGIGNAVVDKEFEVDEAFLAEHGIDKGVMTLVDQGQQAELLITLKQRFAVKKRAGGGSAANTIYATSQFGGNTFYSCKIANDEPGDFYLSELGSSNIQTNLSTERVPGTTGRCLVLVSPDAERTMLTNLAISETFSAADLNPTAISESEYLYIEGYLVTSPSARAAAIEAKKIAEDKAVKIAITLSDPAMVEFFKQGLEEMIGSGVDLLFCNEREASMWTGMDNIEAAAEALKNTAKQFCITLGEEGALLFDGNEFIRVETTKVKAVDTNGAGDMFAGAFLYAINHGFDFATAGKIANQAAAVIVSCFGPRLAPQQHKEILASFA